MEMNLLIILNLFINLFPSYLNIIRRFNSELYLTLSIAEYGYLDIVTDNDGFILVPGEYEHWFLLPWFRVTMPNWFDAGNP